MGEKAIRWCRCKGCGQLLAFHRVGKPGIAPGSVGHEKPIAKLGVPNSVSCAVFNALSAEELTELHSDAPDVDGPPDVTVFFQ